MCAVRCVAHVVVICGIHTHPIMADLPATIPNAIAHEVILVIGLDICTYNSIYNQSVKSLSNTIAGHDRPTNFIVSIIDGHDSTSIIIIQFCYSRHRSYYNSSSI